MRIVISGTYSTGKTLTSIALSLLTNIPVTHARTMREILPDSIPNKRLEKCSFHELIELGVRRFSERIMTEKSMNGSFITDGCPLQEWIYGTTRMLTGLNPDENIWKIKMHKIMFSEEWSVFEKAIKGFGNVAKEYVKNNYDMFIHLPVEFPFHPDGHRPTSEEFREKSEELLVQTYKNLGIEAFEVTGSLHNRLEAILKHCKIKPAMSIAEAIERAYDIKKSRFDAVKLEAVS